MEADTAAVGKGVYEQERLRTDHAVAEEAERRRLNIAEGEAIPINEELAAKIKSRPRRRRKAAQKNAEAKYQLQQMNAAAQIGRLGAVDRVRRCDLGGQETQRSA